MEFDVTSGLALVVGHEGDGTETESITFTGFNKRVEESSVYLLFGNTKGNYMIPLADMSIAIGTPLTDEKGFWNAQLLETNANLTEVQHSPQFRISVLESREPVEETTTPALMLTYRQIYEAWLEVRRLKAEVEQVLTEAEDAKRGAEAAAADSAQSAARAGWAHFWIDVESGEAYVTMTENVAERAAFRINENTGEMEVTFYV